MGLLIEASWRSVQELAWRDAGGSRARDPMIGSNIDAGKDVAAHNGLDHWLWTVLDSNMFACFEGARQWQN